MPGGFRQVLIHSEISFLRPSVGCEENHAPLRWRSPTPDSARIAGIGSDQEPVILDEDIDAVRKAFKYWTTSPRSFHHGSTERVGFEPTVGASPTAVFKTAAFNRSATSPRAPQVPCGPHPTLSSAPPFSGSAVWIFFK
jgi:hypothetical protein